MVLTFWICTALLFYGIASWGFKYPPRDWDHMSYITGAWITITVMVIIAIIISFIFGISLENIMGFPS
jgi:peptidoglycan biosynthesis protein MviN/MurJ (putative lipid II flippase)|tara:strand:+ start:279 stop:482 length:204 start_codon:yes stop_codon:yes gene_type:complete